MQSTTENPTQAGQPSGLSVIAGSQVLDWLANGRVGLSSKTMAMIALGSPPKRIDYPHDPDDLNRCLLLLEAAPGVRDVFPQIAAASKVWAALIANWSEIERSFLDEVGLNWCKARSAPKTYALMRRVIDSANIPDEPTRASGGTTL
jgi:hypothetical protein